ncbi:13E12 repeat family protein [Tessaracoccus sp. OS52]|uniref:DUF222 domain-containing protein n=1 Tax=Tessaracoccus sp. OS52 TaxID=2886691 RepID=UPI001D11BDD0|nr:DUF222 domain-containing protein [Tessaracoccus sp. OS52]MCC2592985.1 13E12 repeat family protein [Tessaracoccus sp. OS52]
MDRKQVANEALAQVERARETIRIAEIRESIAVAELAETYSVGVDTLVEALVEKSVHPGDDGTPAVSEFLGLELGAALGLSRRSALLLVADVLNLKHRHPHLWDAFCRGLIPRWQAVKLTELTSALALEAAQWVDVQLARRAGRISFQRMKRLARGLVAQADPALQQEREELAQHGRGVHFGHPDAGTTHMYASVEALDARRLEQTLGDLACAFGSAGDERSRDERLASALGLLADPAEALPTDRRRWTSPAQPVGPQGQDRRSLAADEDQLRPPHVEITAGT